MIFKNLRNQVSVILERDPAARSVLEVIFCYPGFHAMVFYSFSNRAWGNNFKWLGRFISHLGRIMTGIEIHPAATIGNRLFIDHGMGVVIGATAEIGNNVTLYQGVTLGGTSLERGIKRHPTLEDGVIVGAGAKVLGPVVIGKNARVGSNAVVVANVDAETTVVGVPAKAIRAKNHAATNNFLAYGTPDDVSDPVTRGLEMVLEQVQTLKSRVDELETKMNAVESESSDSLHNDDNL
jgi:serine O-acetyltransferase